MIGLQMRAGSVYRVDGCRVDVQCERYTHSFKRIFRRAELTHTRLARGHAVSIGNAACNYGDIFRSMELSFSVGQPKCDIDRAHWTLPSVYEGLRSFSRPYTCALCRAIPSLLARRH